MMPISSACWLDAKAGLDEEADAILSKSCDRSTSENPGADRST